MAEWSTGDKLGLGMQMGSGLLGALSGSRNQRSNDKTAAAQQVIAALRNRAATMAEQQAGRQRQAEQFASMNPLGAEQGYIQRQKMLQALLPQLGKNQIRPTDPAVAAATPDVGGLGRILGANPGLNAAFSDNAIQRAIYDRRNATTAVDPTIQRMNLGDYGFEDNGFQAENDALRSAVLGRRQASEDAMMGAADEELQRARTMEQQAAEQSKGTPWWRKILGPAAGFGAAFIPGVGPLASMAIGGAVGGISDGARGAALGAAGGFGGEALSARSFNPFSAQSAAQRISSPSWGAEQGNLATAGMLPGGQFPDEVLDQGFSSMRRPELFSRPGAWLDQVVAGVPNDPAYREQGITSPSTPKPQRPTMSEPPNPLAHSRGGLLGGPDARIGANPQGSKWMSDLREYLPYPEGGVGFLDFLRQIATSPQGQLMIGGGALQAGGGSAAMPRGRLQLPGGRPQLALPPAPGTPPLVRTPGGGIPQPASPLGNSPQLPAVSRSRAEQTIATMMQQVQELGTRNPNAAQAIIKAMQPYINALR